MTVNPLQVVAFQTIISRAMVELRGLDPAQLEEAARWILDNRNVMCFCGQCQPIANEEVKAIEAVAAMIVAVAELVAADRHATTCSEAAFRAMEARKHSPR